MRQPNTAEDSLSNQDQKYRDLLEFAPDAFFHGTATGGFLLVNSKAEKLTGYSREELLEMNMPDLFSTGELNEKPLRYDILESGQTIIMEREIVTKSGTLVRVEMSSKQNADKTLQCFMRDVSEKTRRQEELTEIQDHFYKAIQTSPDSFTITDFNGVFKHVNQGFTDFTGYTKEDAIGKSVYDINLWASDNRRDLMIELLKKNGVISNFEAEFRTKQGPIKTALLSVSLIHREGNPHILLVGKDITAQKVSERELKLAKERAEENDRLKSAFLANLSHEIRTPMNGILGFAELLKFPDIDDNTRNQYIDIISRSGKHLLSVINDIIEIAKIETNQLQPNIEKTDISVLLEDIRSQTQLKEDQKNKLKLNFQNDPLELYTDSTKLNQILINLISNAVKFTDEGEITVSYEWRSKDMLSVRVSDTGIGIDEAYQHLVFDRFKQVSGDRNIKTGGSGLGLSISKAYAELLGGWIGFQSTSGKGTTFHLTIKNFQPVTTEGFDACIKTEPQPPHTHPTSLSDFRILVVEDNEVNAQLLIKYLESWRFPYHRAVDGLEAIQLCDQHEFQLILMDIQLPGIDGVETLKRIRKKSPELPIIAQTAHALQEEVQHYLNVGFNAYVTKPIDPKALLRNIQSLM